MAADLSPIAAAFLAQRAPTLPHVADIADRAWFALVLGPDPRLVPKVENFAMDLGFQTFAPRRRHVRRVQIRKKNQKPRMLEQEIVTPLLGRYALVRLPTRSTPFGLFASQAARLAGVVSLVGTPEHGPTMIRDEVVEELRQREAAGEFNGTVRRGKRVVSRMPEWASVGARVVIVRGAFADLPAVVEDHLEADGRLRVGIPMFGGTSSIDVSIADVRP